MNCTSCGIYPVSEARAEAGYTTCMPCAQRVPYKRGVMVVTGKVGNEIQVLNGETYSSNKKYFVANGARSAVKNFSKHCCA